MKKTEAIKHFSKYDSILAWFVAKDDLRPALCSVHAGGDGYVYASDAHIIIRAPEKELKGSYTPICGYPCVDKIVEDAVSSALNTITLSTDSLIAAVSQPSLKKDRYGIQVASLLFSARYMHIIAKSAKRLRAKQITFRYAKTVNGTFSFAGVDIFLAASLFDEANLEYSASEESPLKIHFFDNK